MEYCYGIILKHSVSIVIILFIDSILFYGVCTVTLFVIKHNAMPTVFTVNISFM